MNEDPADEVLDSLDDLVQVMEECHALLTAVRARASAIRDQRSSGATYNDIVKDAPEPLLVQIVTANLLKVERAGHRFRRAEVLALRAEGLSTRQIAKLLHISHERVSVLGRDAIQESPLS